MFHYYFFAFLFLFLKLSDSPAQRYKFSSYHMGTKFRVILYASGDSLAHKAANHAFKKVDTLNNILSDYKPKSELNRLSTQCGKEEWITVSSPLFEILQTAQKVSRKTSGAFDITVGPYVELWRKIRRSYEPSLPSPDTLVKRSLSVGYNKMILDAQDQAVKLLYPHMKLDPGGIAKGYAADQALKVLKSYGIRSALVDAGGDIVLGGPPPGKQGWNISIPSYRNGKKKSISLLIANRAIATSGDLFQFVEIDGVRYSHIVDPRTGIGITNQSKVTVIAPSGIIADSYASAVSVLGSRKGFQLLKQQPMLEGIIEFRKGERVHQKMTNGINSFLTH